MRSTSSRCRIGDPRQRSTPCVTARRRRRTAWGNRWCSPYYRPQARRRSPLAQFARTSYGRRERTYLVRKTRTRGSAGRADRRRRSARARPRGPRAARAHRRRPRPRRADSKADRPLGSDRGARPGCRPARARRRASGRRRRPAYDRASHASSGRRAPQAEAEEAASASRSRSWSQRPTAVSSERPKRRCAARTQPEPRIGPSVVRAGFEVRERFRSHRSARDGNRD